MFNGRGKKYDEDYKKSIVKLIENGKPISEIEREYGISRKNIYNWKYKYEKITTTTGEITNNDEIMKLKRKLQEMEMENEIINHPALKVQGMMRRLEVALC